jgi:predicted RNase H-like nuclease (RuvC/YqgF family)
MKRPEHSECKTNMDYLHRVEEYCTFLENEISTLKTDYSEQVKVTAELRSKLTTFRRIASC